MSYKQYSLEVFGNESSHFYGETSWIFLDIVNTLALGQER